MSTINYMTAEDTLAAARRQREKREREGRLLPDEALDRLAAHIRAATYEVPPAVVEIVAATGREVS